MVYVSELRYTQITSRLYVMSVCKILNDFVKRNQWKWTARYWKLHCQSSSQSTSADNRSRDSSWLDNRGPPIIINDITPRCHNQDPEYSLLLEKRNPFRKNTNSERFNPLPPTPRATGSRIAGSQRPYAIGTEGRFWSFHRRQTSNETFAGIRNLPVSVANELRTWKTEVVAKLVYNFGISCSIESHENLSE